MIDDGHQIGVQRPCLGIGDVGAAKHPQHIGGMAKLLRGRDGWQTGSAPRDRSGQNRYRTDDRNFVGKAFHRA